MGRVGKGAEIRAKAMPSVQKAKKQIAKGALVAICATNSLPVFAGDWNVNHSSEATSGRFLGSPQFVEESASLLMLSTDRDYGNFTLGAGFARGEVPMHGELSGASNSEYLDLRAGLDFGNSLGYVTLGRQETPGRDQGRDMVGLGLRVSLNRALQLTGEFLHYSPSSDAATDQASGTSLSIQAAFRF